MINSLIFYIEYFRSILLQISVQNFYSYVTNASIYVLWLMNKKTLHYQNGPLKDLNRLLEDMDGNFLNHLDRIGKAISCLLREAHELVSKIYCNV